MNKTATT